MADFEHGGSEDIDSCSASTSFPSMGFSSTSVSETLLEESSAVIITDKNGFVVELSLPIETETEISSCNSSAYHNGNSNQLFTGSQQKHIQSNSESYELLQSTCYPKISKTFAETVVHCDNIENTSVTDRKHKDMMRKRLLRQSLEYRCQEAQRSRNRMKLKRSDPLYRELERQRDRDRRRAARIFNPEQRAAERERDKIYKRKSRNNSVQHYDLTVAHEVVVGLHNSCLNLEHDAVAPRTCEVSVESNVNCNQLTDE